MAFPESFLDELIAKNDIISVVSAYTTLKKQGGRYFGLCPFHNEKTPSFTVTPQKDLYYCFGCGKGGGVISFIMEQEGLDFQDAVYFLARRAGMTVPDTGDDAQIKKRRRMLELNRTAARWFNENLSGESGKAVVDFLRLRRILPKTAARFGLGAAPDSWDALVNAMTAAGYSKQELIEANLASAGKNGGIYDRFRNKLIFPVIDVRGDVLGFGSRVLDDSKPKYVNSQDTLVYTKRRTLYGMHLAKNTKRGSIILCEGNIDVLTLHQAGFDNAVASMGTSLTLEQTKLISRYVGEVVICYDNDPAGIKATNRAIELMENSELSVKVVKLPDQVENGVRVKIDVDDYIKKYGADKFEKLLSGSENDVEYQLSRLREGYDLDIDDQKVEYLRRAGQLIAALPSPVEREVYASREASAAGLPVQAMRLEVERSRKSLIRRDRAKKDRQNLSPAQMAQPSDRQLRYDNVRSAVAEEGVLRIAVSDPKLLEGTDLKAGEFSSPVLARAFEVLIKAYKEGKQAGMSALAEELTPEENSLVARALSSGAESTDRKKALYDYIAAIRAEKEKKAAAGSEDALRAVYESYRNKKGYGG